MVPSEEDTAVLEPRSNSLIGRKPRAPIASLVVEPRPPAARTSLTEPRQSIPLT